MKSPKTPAPPSPPPLPSKDAAADSVRDSGAMKRRGYQSTILGSRNTATSPEVTAAKTLLGQ